MLLKRLPLDSSACESWVSPPTRDSAFRDNQIHNRLSALVIGPVLRLRYLNGPPIEG